MAVDCTRINALSAEMNAINRNIATLIRALDFFPTANLVKTLEKMYKLIQLLEDLPPIVWEVLIKFVACNDQALAQLSVAQLKKHAQVLLAQAEMELLLSDADANLRTAIERWITELNRVIANWDDNAAVNVAAAAIKGLKDFLKTNYPAILEALADYFGKEIDDAIVEWAKKQIATEVRKIIKQVVEKILVKRLGQAAASKLIPYIGVILTAIELAAYTGVVEEIKDLKEYVAKLLLEVMKLFAQCFDWPATCAIEFRGPKAAWQGTRVTLRPFIRCAKIVNGKPVWGNPCLIKFKDGTSSKTVLLDADYDALKGRYRIDNEIDQASRDNSPCAAGASLCYWYLELIETFPNGTKQVRAGICGAKEFQPQGLLDRDVTDQMALVRSGFRLSNTSGRVVQTVSITNRGPSELHGLLLVFDGLGANATLFLADGSTQFTLPTGSPYLLLDVGEDSHFTPGEVVRATVEFTVASLASAPNYRLRVLEDVGLP